MWAVVAGCCHWPWLRLSVLLFVLHVLVALYSFLASVAVFFECLFNLKVCIPELDSVSLSELPIHPVP